MHRCDECGKAARYYIQRYEGDTSTRKSCTFPDHMAVMLAKGLRDSASATVGTYVVTGYAGY